MNKNTLQSRTENFGDFYIYFSKLTKDKRKVRQLEVGTSEFDNKYILEHLPRGFTLEKVQAQAAERFSKGLFMFWSWTANRLITVPAKSVTRVTGMSSELQNGRMF